MNITKYITLAVILGQFAASDLAAQKSDPNSPKTVQTEPLDDVKTAPVDGDDIKTAPVDGSDTTGLEPERDQGEACGEPLQMRIEANEILVTGGQPGAMVALLIGFDEASFYVGTAHIRLFPLAVLALDSFDENGEYLWRLPASVSGAPVTVKIQAISQDEAGCFHASDRWTLNYHGETQFDGSRDVDIALLRPRGFEGELAGTRRLAA